MTDPMKSHPTPAPAQRAKRPTNVNIDVATRTVAISARGPLDLAPEVVLVPFSVIKHVAATILGVEAQHEEAAQKAARAAIQKGG